MLKGSIVALVTPFLEDGSINYDSLGELIEYHINNKTDGILVLGTTGEASTILEEDCIEVVKYCVNKVNKRVPLIVGAGSNSTLIACNKAKCYSELGADYLLCVTPYYNKTNNMGLIKHYEAIADVAKCPIILYNVPSRTGMSIPMEVIEVLANNPNIIGIKEASGNIDYLRNVSKYLNDNFLMFAGNDDMVALYMQNKAVGVISVLANIAPIVTHQICEYCLNNDFESGFKLNDSLLDVVNALFYETNPIPVKEAMNYLGFNVGGFHLPLYNMDPIKKDKMIKVLDCFKESIY